MEALNLTGVWWLPDNPEIQVSGVLKFEPNNEAFLELIGSFKEFRQMGSSQNLSPALILGVTTNGKYVTLYKCFESATQFSMPGLISSAFVVNYIFVGVHFSKEEVIGFNELDLFFPYLEAWVGKTGFKSEFGANEKGHLTQYKVEYSFPDKFEAVVDHLKISTNYKFSDGGGEKISEIHLSQKTSIKIGSDRRLGFAECLADVISPIQNFLSLGVGKAIYPYKIVGRNSDCVDQVADKKYPFEVLIYFKINPEEGRKIHFHEMFFRLPDIQRSFEVCLKNWFAKSRLLEPVFDLYFATLYQPSMHLQNKFLNLVQALETYHRRAVGGSCIEEEEYKKIYTVLKAALPQDLSEEKRSHLVQRMQYLGEYALRARLESILMDLKSYIPEIITNEDEFAGAVANTRNYLTHFDKKLEEKAKTGVALYKITYQLKYVVELCLLKELELSSEEILKLTKRNKSYEYLKTLEIPWG